MKTVTRIVLPAAAILMSVSSVIAQRPEGVRPAVLIQVAAPSPAAAARSPLAVIERLMSFDANKDHRITREELPERMQALIARWDKNADAALDSEEVRAAVNTASSDRTRVAFRVQASDGFAGVISDLKLSPEKREQALAILSAHTPAPKVNEPVDADLYKAMRPLLDDEEYENFVAAATRLSKTVPIRMGIGEIVRPLPPPPPVR